MLCTASLYNTSLTMHSFCVYKLSADAQPSIQVVKDTRSYIDRCRKDDWTMITTGQDKSADVHASFTPFTHDRPSRRLIAASSSVSYLRQTTSPLRLGGSGSGSGSGSGLGVRGMDGSSISDRGRTRWLNHFLALAMDVSTPSPLNKWCRVSVLGRSVIVRDRRNWCSPL